MFTGLIEEVGVLARINTISGGRSLFVSAAEILTDCKVDDSVAVNGICLTVTAKEANGFWVDAVGDTLEKTTLKDWQVGQKLNLERALRLSDRLGGHLVQGHVNGVGRIVRLTRLGENYFLEADVPAPLLRYLIPEGSVAVDGISLTVARLNGSRMGISIIPHTYKHTNLCERRVGDSVNLEVDVIAKYVERLLKFSKQENGDSPFSDTWFKKMGF
ncbi:MAG: riboflavin synthase [Calditrichaeota bacterium]|nr:riboflavin synthase [Calditrichota bacterium]